ncbi:hypothetical protein D046_3677A, partial [Vibrio parahaemolyticus V-223/04]
MLTGTRFEIICTNMIERFSPSCSWKMASIPANCPLLTRT